MNIQKSRLAALFSVMLIVCMMTAMLVVPASAATFEVDYCTARFYVNPCAAQVYKLANADLHESETYEDLAVSVGIAANASGQGNVSPDGNSVYLTESTISIFIDKYNTAFPDTPIEMPALPVYKDKNEQNLYRVTGTGLIMTMGQTTAGKLTYETTGKLVDSLGDSSLSGVLNQIIDLLPIVIPVLIGFIGLNKAIQFITGVLHSA